MSGPAAAAHALDHVVVVLFENRSLDNVLGHLYGPGDGKSYVARHYFPGLAPDTANGR